MAVPLRGGGGVEGLPLRIFFYSFFICWKVPTAIKLEEGKASMALPLRKELFFGFPKEYLKSVLSIYFMLCYFDILEG